MEDIKIQLKNLIADIESDLKQGELSDKATNIIQLIKLHRVLDLLSNITQDRASLRDYFAAKAMQSLYSTTSIKDNSEQALASDSEIFYDIADAMLKQREL